jgi:hypothetical protein
MQRALQLRAEFVSCGISDEKMLSAFFLLRMKATEHFKDWAIQQLQVDPPPKLTDLVSNLRTTFRDLLDETITSTDPRAHVTHTGKNQCTYCKNTEHHILCCRKLRSDQQAYDERQATKHTIMMLDGNPIAGVSEAVAEAVAISAKRIRLERL